MVTVNYLVNENIIYVQIIGGVGHLDIIGFLDEIRNNKEIPKRSKLLTDFSEAVLENTDTSGIKEIVDYFKMTFTGRFEYLQWASVAKSPLLNVGAILFVDSAKPANTSYRVFTTLESALIWLGAPKLINDLNN